VKAKLLFVDDRARRIREAIAQYGKDFDLTIAPNVQEALKALSHHDFTVVSLDHDLEGHEFQDTDAADCGMEVIRYLRKTGWPPGRKKPQFWIHSYNAFAATNMVGSLRELGFEASLHVLRYPKYETGIVAGAFDGIHPGYIRLFEDCKTVCSYLIVALHIDPSYQNSEKLKPILSVEERKEILMAVRYVDEVIPYRTEADLDDLFDLADVRIVGSDHQGSSTRPNLGIKTYYHIRNHEWSNTRYKQLIAESLA
jgi:glycerol-3-phosphate cytidylyltransferase